LLLAILDLVAQRDRLELAALLKKAERHRQRITELQTELALLQQRIASVEGRRKAEGERRKGPTRRYK
jgi:hypothetical protein